MANISTTDLPLPASTYTKTTQTVENYTLKSGRVYKFEVFGAKGGGNGSRAVGWYDMRTSADVTVSIFAGGSNSWSATQFGAQLTGTSGGGNGGSGGGASGIYVGATALLVAGGGGGNGGGGTSYLGSNTSGGAGGGQNGGGGGGYGGGGASQSGHGSGGIGWGLSGSGTADGWGNSVKGRAGSASGGGSGSSAGGGYGSCGGGGGAGGGYARGFAGGGGGMNVIVFGESGIDYSGGGGGGGSGGTSYIGGVQSLKDAAGKASTTWAHSGANGNGKIIITEYIMAVNVASPTSPDDDIYTVSTPSKTSALFGESYTFTVTREIGVGHIGLKLNSPNGTLSLTSTNGNVFTYTVSNVQGAITSADFSTTSYNVAKPPDDTGYTITDLSATSVLKGGSYSFTIAFDSGYTQAFVKLNTINGKVNYSGIDMNTLTITISNIQGIISASDFTVIVAKTL